MHKQKLTPVFDFKLGLNLYTKLIYTTFAKRIKVWYCMGLMLTKRVKTTTIKNVARHEADTGSPEVQIAVLTRRIDELAKHLKKNHKDFHSRRGLLQMVADRRTHLRYLEKSDKRNYNATIKKLGLKH